MMKINWVVNSFGKYTGYGRMGCYFVRELCSLGVEVIPAQVSLFETAEWMRPMLSGFDPDALTISLTLPNLMPDVKRQWGFTMYEDTSIPDGWAEAINEKCERLLVLCEHNAETFAGAGVTVPIHVVHGGTDPNEFPLIKLSDRPVDGPYTFLCLGDRGVRKGVEVAWSAFFEGFEGIDDVRLIVKIRAGSSSPVQYGTFDDPRISIWQEDVEDIADVYRQADCFVFPSYGEGWGMPPREAAMMGLPVIATNWSGLDVGIENWAIPIHDYEMRTSQLMSKNAQWAVPNTSAVARAMRWCYENQEQARLKGLNAHHWLAGNQTWQHSAEAIKALIEEYG